MKYLYTAIFSNYDTLAPIKLPDGWRALCFTDSNIIAKGWEIIKTTPEPKIFRKIKICPHLFLPEDTTLSMWIDGNLQPKMPLNHLIKGKDTGYTLMSHPSRNCVYTEGQRCIELNKDDPKVINAQLAKYRAARYPEKNGMVATGVLIRTNGFEAFAEEWWNEVKNHSVRDQISFLPIAQKHRLHYKLFPFLQGFGKTIHTGKTALQFAK